MGNCYSQSEKEDNTETEAKHAATSSSLAARERKIHDLQSRLQEAAKEISNLQADGKNLENELAALSQKHLEEVDGLRNDLRQRKDDLVARDRVIESIRSERDEQRSESEETKQQLNQLAMEKDELNDLLKSERQNTIALLASKDSELESERQAHNRLRATREGLEIDISGLRLELSNAAAESTRRLAQLQKIHEKELNEQKAQATRVLQSTKDNAEAEMLLAKAQAQKRIEEATTQAQQRQASSTAEDYSNIDFSEPVRFSVSEKDLCIEVCEWRSNIRIDIRQWYRAGRWGKVRANSTDSKW
jgi:chromosome segregation ATPase